MTKFEFGSLGIAVIGAVFAYLQVRNSKKQTEFSQKQFEAADAALQNSLRTEKLKISGGVIRDIAHEFQLSRFENLGLHQIQLCISGVGEKPPYIKQVDWGLRGKTIKQSFAIEQSLPIKTKRRGVTFSSNLNEIDLSVFFSKTMSFRRKIQLLNLLQIETTITTENNAAPLPVPRSLKVALFRKYSDSEFQNWLSELILCTDISSK